ncbi:MAG TPA: alpha-L-fucosidase [Lacunisphaera sp.]
MKLFIRLAWWLGIGLSGLGISRAELTTTSGRADWMRTARWGVMTHYLADWRAQVDGGEMTVERWNRLIDGFDVETLAAQLQSVGAGYYLISLGQNSGYYLAPNATYDRLTGASPSKCARRDLVADLATALGRRGIRLLVYLPSGAPAGDMAARTALEWENGPHRNAAFQQKWEAVITDWSRRWGSVVSGWWFDGCYWPNHMYRASGAPDFASFAAAARAGNPRAVVAFNPGVMYRPISMTPEDDYLAGEVDKPERWEPRRAMDGRVDGAQIHVLSYLGEKWGKGDKPRFSTAEAVTQSLRVASAGGVITWDAPVKSDGTLAPEFVTQLKEIGAALRSQANGAGTAKPE